MKKFFLKNLMKNMSSPMISCEQASYLVSKKQHVKLSLREHMSLRLHHVVCKFCKMYEKEINLISGKIAEFIKAEKKGVNQHNKIPEERKQKMAEIVREQLES